MEPVSEQHLELKKNLSLNLKVITEPVTFRVKVAEKGSVWKLPEAAAYITFQEAVPKPLLFTCSVLPPKLCSPPISGGEVLVSNVIELSHDGSPDLEFSGDDEGKVTVALLHSASDLKGYEVVIKQLVDPLNNKWKDLKTWRASVPDFPDIQVEVPLTSVPVDQDFTWTIKVQEFPNNEVEKIGMLCSPVIHISSSQNIVHMTIKVPLTLRESKHDFSKLSNDVIRILYLDSEGKPWNTSWTDITGQLEGPLTLKDGNVEFKVKHFCRFCPVSIRPTPQDVYFLVCFSETTVPDTYAILLYCYPSFKRDEVEKELSRFKIPYKGEGKSKEPVCVGDEIVVSLVGVDFVRESQRNEKLVLRFLGNDVSDNRDMALIVHLDSEIAATVKFCKDKELQKLLCEVPIIKTAVSVVPVTVAPALGTSQEIPARKPRTKPKKRKRRREHKVKASGYTEVKQEEENGSAAKKPKLVSTGEPRTSGVSSTNKTRKFKETKKISFANSNPEVVSHGERKEEKESDQIAGRAEEMQQESQGKRHSPRKRGAVADVRKGERDNEDGYKAKRSKETAIQDPKKILPVGEKKAEKMSHQKDCHPSEPDKKDRIMIEIGSSEDEDESSDDEPCASGQNVADKQEEKSGSAAKTRKLNPIGEPGTSGVSSTSKKRKFQESVDPSDSESSSFETDDSDSKSDGNSNTDTDSDREEEDFDFSKKKPVKAKQKVSKKTTTKKQKAKASSKTNREDKNEKGTCAQTVNNEKGKASKPRDSKKKVKQGKPTRKELMGLGRDIGNKWRILGECLEVEEELDSIDHGYKNLTEKGFQVLKYWTQKNGSSATYRVLSGALEDELLARKDLSQKYCYG